MIEITQKIKNNNTMFELRNHSIIDK